MSLYAELKRRNVFRVTFAYLAAAWLLTEVAGTLFPGFGIPDWAFRFVVIVLAIGFVPTLIFSWAYEITPEGLKREKDVVRDESITHLTAKRLDGITIGIIVVALAFILADRFWLSPRLAEQSGAPEAVVADPGQLVAPVPAESQYPPNSIAVLPFVNMSDDPANEYFSDGISEELLNLLAKIPELRVSSRSSAFYFKGEKVDIPTVAEKLNVAHILEGSVRKAGNQVRITAQLIETRSDTHLWSETYDRPTWYDCIRISGLFSWHTSMPDYHSPSARKLVVAKGLLLAVSCYTQ
jgi:TolB-like protein